MLPLEVLFSKFCLSPLRVNGANGVKLCESGDDQQLLAPLIAFTLGWTCIASVSHPQVSCLVLSQFRQEATLSDPLTSRDLVFLKAEIEVCKVVEQNYEPIFESAALFRICGSLTRPYLQAPISTAPLPSSTALVLYAGRPQTISFLIKEISLEYKAILSWST